MSDYKLRPMFAFEEMYIVHKDNCISKASWIHIFIKRSLRRSKQPSLCFVPLFSWLQQPFPKAISAVCSSAVACSCRKVTCVCARSFYPLVPRNRRTNCALYFGNFSKNIGKRGPFSLQQAAYLCRLLDIIECHSSKSFFLPDCYAMI